MKLWKFELKKLWRRKQFLLFTFIAIIGVAVLYFQSYWSQDDIVDRNAIAMASHSSTVAPLVDLYNNEMELRTESDNLDETFIAMYENVHLMSQHFNEWFNSVREMNWEFVPQNEMAFIETVLQHMEYGGDYGGYSDGQLEQSLKRNQILIENNLPFEDEQFSLAAPNFMKSVFTKMLSILGLGLLVIILGDSMVREKEQHTIRTLSTQPITSSRLLFGKLVGKLSAIIYMLIIIIIACFTMPLLFGGSLGSFSYPQLIYTNTGFEFIPISEYLILYVLIFFGATSFLLSIILLLSALFNDRLTVLFFSLLILFGGVALTTQITALQSIINPFYYFQFQQLIEYREQLVHPLFIILPYVVAILIVILSSFLLKRRKVNSTKTQNNAPLKNGTVHKRKKDFSITTIFEWRKYLREGIVKRFSITILFLIVVGYVVIAFQTHQLEEHYFSSKKESISGLHDIKAKEEQNKKNNEEVVQELENRTTPLSENEKMLLESARSSVIFHDDFANDMLTEANKLEREMTAYQNGEWSIVYDYWIDELTVQWEGVKFIDNAPTKRIGGGSSDFTYLASVEEKEWLKEHQLEPAFINEYTPYTWTIYDEYISPVEQLQWNRDTRKVSDTGLFYVYTFFTTPSYVILYALLLFILGAGMAAEKSDRRTIALLQTQPVKSRNIYFGKTTISMLLATGIAALSVFSMVLIGTLVNRFGDWKFPIVHYDPPSLVDAEGYTGFVAEEGGFHFMYMGRYLLETGSLFLASVLFLLALSLFFSLFFKNTMTVFVTTVIVAAGGYVLSTHETFSTFAQWLPFTYLDIGKIANGQMAAVLGNEGITTVTGVIALIIGIIIFLVGGLLISGRKKGSV